MQPALSSKGAIPKTVGVLSPKNPNGIGTSAQNMSLAPSSTPRLGVSSMSALGNNTGMINQPKPDTTYTHTTTTNNTGGTTSKPTPNPSVLAQQQALNKQGAGLVEDGIAGPKTAAAIAQYGTKGTTIATPTETKVTPPTEYSSSNPATFSGLVNKQANVSSDAANTGSENYNTANTGLMNSLGQNQVLSDRAQEIANTAGQTMSDIGRKGAMGQAGYRTTGTSPVGEGNAAVLAQTTAAQQQAVAQGANMELQGTQQGLTAQNQTQSGFNNASGNALTGQGQGISGLNNAANLAQPNATSQGQTTYNPLTNSFGGGSYGTNLSTVVNAIKSGNIGYTDGVNSLSSLSPTAKADVLAALGQGFDTIKSDAQSGIKTQQTGQIAGYQSALQQGQNLQSQLTDLIKSFGLNPNDINVANSGIQKIASNVSDPHYKQLQNYVNDIANTYSQILVPPGGSSTDTSRGIATSMLDATASGTSILDTMKSLDEAAKAKIAGVSTTGNTSGGTTGGTMFGSFF